MRQIHPSLTTMVLTIQVRAKEWKVMFSFFSSLNKNKIILIKTDSKAQAMKNATNDAMHVSQNSSVTTGSKSFF